MRLIRPQWEAPVQVNAFVTTRSGGISSHPYASLNLGEHVGDDLGNVLANRLAVRAHLPSDPIWLNQTHSTTVSTPASRKLLGSGIPIDVDASITNIPGEVLAIMTADCLPVLISSMDGTVVGAAHAGWRGLCAGVIENTVSEMRKLAPKLACDDFIAWLGPAIGPQSFEVGHDVVKAFEDVGTHKQQSAFMAIDGRPGKYLADIYQLASERLSGLGISKIAGGDRCTVIEDQDFFSYRRDGKTGRFATFIWISK